MVHFVWREASLSTYYCWNGPSLSSHRIIIKRLNASENEWKTLKINHFYKQLNQSFRHHCIGQVPTHFLCTIFEGWGWAMCMWYHILAPWWLLEMMHCRHTVAQIIILWPQHWQTKNTVRFSYSDIQNEWWQSIRGSKRIICYQLNKLQMCICACKTTETMWKMWLLENRSLKSWLRWDTTRSCGHLLWKYTQSSLVLR